MELQASTDTGSILNLAWTSDGTQVAGAGASGRICFAQLVGLSAEVGPVRATVTDKNSVEVLHLMEETKDELDFSDRVIMLCLGGVPPDMYTLLLGHRHQSFMHAATTAAGQDAQHAVMLHLLTSMLQ